jgi:hypothetical protein
MIPMKAAGMKLGFPSTMVPIRATGMGTIYGPGSRLIFFMVFSFQIRICRKHVSRQITIIPAFSG